MSMFARLASLSESPPVVATLVESSPATSAKYSLSRSEGWIWKVNEKHRLYLSAFNNADIFKVDYKLPDSRKPTDYERAKGGIDFGNTTAALRWNWLVNKKLFANTTLAYTRYQFNTIAGYEIKQDTSIESANAVFFSGIKDWSGRFDMDYLPNPKAILIILTK